MSPKTGRPTTEPKNKFLKMRMSQEDLDKLSYVAEKRGMTKTDVVRKGIEIQLAGLKDK